MTKQFLAIYNVYDPRSRASKWSTLSAAHIRHIHMMVNAPESSTTDLVYLALLGKKPKVGEYESVELKSVLDMADMQRITLGETVGLEVVESDD